jgi:hypothetical protein
MINGKNVSWDAVLVDKSKNGETKRNKEAAQMRGKESDAKEENSCC